MKKQIKLYAIDDHQLVLDGLKMLLSAREEVAWVGSSVNGIEALEDLTTVTVDVLLLDVEMPEMNGIEVCKLISARFPHIRIIALTMLIQTSIIHAMKNAGAKGFLVKNTSAEELLFAINEVANGHEYYSKEVLVSLNKGLTIEGTSAQIPKLSRREKEITRLIMDSLSTREIADQLNISHGTVETHRKNILRKLGVKNSAGLVKMVMEHRLLS